MVSGQVTSTYLGTPGKTKEYFEAIRKGTAPSKFTQEFLLKLGFKSTGDRPLIPLLRDLGFLDSSNQPTSVYREYLDAEKSAVVLGRQILSAYEGLFELERDAHKSKGAQLQGKFKSIANVSESVADKMAGTFTNLCSIADVDGARGRALEHKKEERTESQTKKGEQPPAPTIPLGLSYNIEIHLPNTTDYQVYNAIFRALKENLLR